MTLKQAGRDLRYLLEFGLPFYFARLVIPTRNWLVRGHPPRVVDSLEHTTSKEDVRQQKIGPLARLLSRKISSGGTTGVPVTFFEFYWVTLLERMYALHLWSLVGWRPAHRTLVLRGNRIPGSTERRGRMLVVSSYRMGPCLAEITAAVAGFDPQWVWAYPSVYMEFARLSGSNRPLPRPQGFLFASEKLYAWQREELATAYPNTRILDWYASSEKAALAYRIHPTTRYRFVSSYAKVDLVPLDPAQPAPRRCSLFGTSLIQAPTRIERYRSGDIAIVNEFDEVEDILGREQDLVQYKDGSIAAFSQVVGSIHSDVWEHVLRFRIEQERSGELEIYLEEKTVDRQQFLRREFEEKIAAQIGGRLELNFHFGPVLIKRSQAGKSIYFIQHLPLATAAKQ